MADYFPMGVGRTRLIAAAAERPVSGLSARSAETQCGAGSYQEETFSAARRLPKSGQMSGKMARAYDRTSTRGRRASQSYRRLDVLRREALEKGIALGARQDSRRFQRLLRYAHQRCKKRAVFKTNVRVRRPNNPYRASALPVR
ncbi:hypothetical protein [Paraburkholderia sp. DGU8]|uniref:hypothetical protein n=1 Tax=Paraburkholderia sp. DGU8 TaxID=3161997 RepID=UPI0034662040